jgi:hypothetical protein
MIFGEIMAMIDGIGRVRNLLLNEHEKQIVKTLVLKFDESSLFDPKNTVKYALISNKGNFSKLYLYEDYLKRHARIISSALSQTENVQLIEKLKGFKTVNKEFGKLHEEFEISDEEINLYKGEELPRLREIIDRYRWLMSQCILSLIQSVDIEISTVKVDNFRAVTVLTESNFTE